jgi:hypothetical protein
MSIHGGLECGETRRVQPVIGELVMGVAKSCVMTPRALKTEVEWLKKQTVALRAESCGLSDFSALQRLAREFVDNISRVSVK